MKGLYFVDTDLGNQRAHTLQLLQSATAISVQTPLKIIAPRYGSVDAESLQAKHELLRAPDIRLLFNFGLKSPGRISFLAFNIPAALFLCAQKCKGEVAYVYIRSNLLMPLALVAFLLRVPLFYETHRLPLSVGERVRDSAISYVSTGLIIISTQVQKYYRRFNKKTIVVHDAVALSRFGSTLSREQGRHMLGISLDVNLCVYTGTISIRKGVDTLFAAARALPDVEFVLAGHMNAEFSHTSLPKNVRWLGHLEQSKLPPLLAAADVLLLPHPRNEYSQSPMKLFEYMASGVPIVSSRLPSVSEVLHDQNAILVEPEDPAALVQGITRALTHRAEGAKLAAQARIDVDAYTWEERGRKIARFINDAVPPEGRFSRFLLLARCLAYYLWRGSAKCVPKNPQRFIVVLTGKLGDIVCGTPVLRALRTQFPNAQITAVGGSVLSPLLADSGLADRYLAVEQEGFWKEVRRVRADAAFITGPSFSIAAKLYLTGIPLISIPRIEGGRSPLQTRPYEMLRTLTASYPYRMGAYAPRERLRSLEPIRAHSDDTAKRLGYSSQARERVDLFWKTAGIPQDAFVVGVSVTAGNKIKEWPPERFVEVVDALVKEYSAKIVLMGSGDDRERVQAVLTLVQHRAHVIDAQGKFSLDELKAAIARLSLFIAVDTGPIYIAEAFSVPTIDIVGPMNENEQPPRGDLHRVVTPPFERTPQLSILNARSFDPREALRQTLSITAGAVLEEVRQLAPKLARIQP